jgi:hypothetical protein
LNHDKIKVKNPGSPSIEKCQVGFLPVLAVGMKGRNRSFFNLRS